MAKYNKFQRKSPEKKKMSPIWRGIGCILLVIAPVLAYFLMVWFLPTIIATGKVPYQLLGRANLPGWAFTTPMVVDIANYIGGIDNLWISMVTFIVILLVLISSVSLLYSMIYMLVGPARYTELDAPPSTFKTKVYKR